MPVEAQVILHHLVLPVIFLGWLALERFRSQLQWVLTALTTSTFITLGVLAGAWAWVGYPLRFLFPALLVLALVHSYRRIRGLPRTQEWSWKSGLDASLRLFPCLIFIAAVIAALVGYRSQTPAVALDFPLRNGVYVVGQGGSRPLINYHNVHPSQRYALDILRLNAVGLRARGLYPSRLEQYIIFEDAVYSPCTGRVVFVQDGLPDLSPPESDPTRPAGNSVAVECRDVVVYLAHFREGTVRVQVGEAVERGAPLGLVGNSGNTSEPHLHIHAEQGPYGGGPSGQPGVPMRFEGRFLVRNSLVWRSE